MRVFFGLFSFYIYIPACCVVHENWGVTCKLEFAYSVSQKDYLANERETSV